MALEVPVLQGFLALQAYRISYERLREGAGLAMFIQARAMNDWA